MKVNSRVIGCGADSFSVIIGWIQAILSGISVFAFATGVIWFSCVVCLWEEPDWDSDPTFPWNLSYDVLVYYLIKFVIYLLLSIISSMAGVILVIGVRQQDETRLLVWISLAYTVITLQVFELLYYILKGEMTSTGWIENTITVLLLGFCAWVVNIHREDMIVYKAAHRSLGAIYDFA